LAWGVVGLALITNYSSNRLQPFRPFMRLLKYERLWVAAGTLLQENQCVAHIPELGHFPPPPQVLWMSEQAKKKPRQDTGGAFFVVVLIARLRALPIT
jgi:hypothetical protein